MGQLPDPQVSHGDDDDKVSATAASKRKTLLFNLLLAAMLKAVNTITLIFFHQN